jgi:hypothetical protein
MFLSVCGVLSAQTKIHIDFSHFGGKEYVVYLLKGDKQDTVCRGALDKQGKASIVIPSAYKNFKGIARWSLIDSGGLEFALNGEKTFTVLCSAASPDDDNISYIGTPENEFMYGQYLRQSAVINKAVAVGQTLQLYKPADSLYTALDLEKQKLERQFEVMQSVTAQNPLYAARIREFSDYLTHIGSRLTLTQEDLEQERSTFIENKLNIEELYYSGFWDNLLTGFIGSVAENDSLLVADSRLLLAQVSGNERIKEDLLYKFILLYNKYGKENLLVHLGIEDLVSAGRLAPMLRLTNKYIRPIRSLIIFYESGCNNCENELVQLRGNYPVLKEKGIDVISVAADLDEATFKKNADLFPWTDKYCDYKGFYGENFVNYLVKGTPTIFVTDGEGKIAGRFAKLAEAWETLK